MSQKALEKRKHIRNQLAKHNRWYDIKNKDGEVAEIRIYDEISFWGITADDFVSDLDEISAPKITVAINSPGGDVFDGIAVYNALRSHPADVTTRVDGIAASIAAVIVQAGDHRVMLSAAQMMVHKAWGLAIGNDEDMESMRDVLAKQNEVVAGIFAERGTKEKQHYLNLMSSETWLTDEESVTEGLADEVVNPSKAEKVAPAARATRTLNDEITEAVDAVSTTLESAERVAALRAEHGEELSKSNASGLDELTQLTERLKAVAQGDPESVDAPSETSDEDVDASQGTPQDDEILRLNAAMDEALSR